MKNLSIPLFAILVSFLIMVGNANASSLTITENNQLDHWFGIDNDYINIWHGDTGATTDTFNTAVNDAGPTISVYTVTRAFGDGKTTEYRIGGYTKLSWGGGLSYKTDNDAFLFNFTENFKQDAIQDAPRHTLTGSTRYFPAFGHYLYGGRSVLNTGFATHSQRYISYDDEDPSQLINILGDIDTHLHQNLSHTNFDIISLDVYTLSPHTTTVPVPPAIWLLITGFIGLFTQRKLPE